MTNNTTSNKNPIALILAILAVLVAQPVTHAQAGAAGSLIREGIEELMEQGTKQLLKGAGREAAEVMGREAAETLFKKAVQEGGEELGERAMRLVARYGKSAGEVLSHSPKAFTEALEKLPVDKVPGALGAVRRNPKVMTRLVQEFGERGISAELKHPGLGAKLVSEFGENGLKLADTLSTEEVRLIMSHMNRMPAGDRASFLSGVLEYLKKGGKSVADFLEAHPKTFGTGTVGAVLYLSKDNFFGKTGERVIHPDGTITEPAPGFFERVAKGMLSPVAGPLQQASKWLGYLISGFLSAALAIWLWGFWRTTRLKVQKVKQDVENRSS